jgi:hypothetical protein
MHIDLLVEEPSAKEVLRHVLPQLLPAGATHRILVFQGKHDLLNKLPVRMRGYAGAWGADSRVVVLVDEDRQDCHDLKRRLEQSALDAGLTTATHPDADGQFQVLTRIAVEELEAWFFGDIEAIRTAYPRVSPHLGQQSRYRDPDAIAGGTWESLERVLQRAGYFEGGLNKMEAARAIGPHMLPGRNRSRSFRNFATGLQRLR